jgi:hypothetical protein
VARRHPLVGHADRELGADAPGAALGTATERDRREVAQPVADRAGARSSALEYQDQNGLRSRTDATGLAILVEAKGRALRVTHSNILTSLGTEIVRGFL